MRLLSAGSSPTIDSYTVSLDLLFGRSFFIPFDAYGPFLYRLTLTDNMLDIMSEQKKPEREDITLSGDTLRKYFPRSYTPRQMETVILRLLDAWMKKRQHEQSR